MLLEAGHYTGAAQPIERLAGRSDRD